MTDHNDLRVQAYRKRRVQAYRLEHGCAHQEVRPTSDGNLECLEGCGRVLTKGEFIEMLAEIAAD